jgi:hypothetical protein
MKKTGWFYPLYNPLRCAAMVRRIAGSIGVASLLMMTGIAVAQDPAGQASLPPISAPNGYSIHQSIDLGGRVTNLVGSGSMYDTMINLQSGMRVQGEIFELHALPSNKHTLVDDLTAYGSGFGGDPYNYAKVDFSKSKYYEFSSLFRRDRQYFDYDLLGNPNIVSGQSIPIGPVATPTGSLAWPQANQSPFLFNTVRRMTDTSLTLLPLSKVTFRVEYSQNIFQGPSLSPGASSNFFAESIGANDMLLQEYQRNSTDDFLGAVEWKPVRDTRLTIEERITHYKADSFFTVAPTAYYVQEADGTLVAPGNYDSEAPYGLSSCNTGSMSAPSTILSAPQTPGGLPVINAACDVASSYLRSQPTRILFPTEIFRLQSSSLRNVAMNGEASYTNANMKLPNYYENFQGLDGAIRSITYTGNASAERQVISTDFGIVWQPAPRFSLAEQIDYSNLHQPGIANISTGATLVIPTAAIAAGQETINYSGPLSAGNPGAVEGNPNGTPTPGYFGQKFIINNLTGTWDATSRATLSLTYRHRTHSIVQGAATGSSSSVVDINENGGIFAVALRPTNQWDINGSVEALYDDNALTPIGPRQTRQYRVHSIYRPKSWATISGAFNDRERHNNTNNTGATPADGPLDHVDHSRVASFSAALYPNGHYGLDFSYAYSDVYTATNICYDAGASASLPGAATASGTACPGGSVRGAPYYEYGPARDFMNAPTQYGSVSLALSPSKKAHSDVGYRISAVNGSRFFNDAQDVNGSMVSSYQSPFVKLSWTVHSGWVWNAEYDYFGYGEGGPSGAPLCSTTNPTLSTPAPGVPCSSLVGVQTGMTISPAGETAPRNFHANNLTLGMHFDF